MPTRKGRASKRRKTSIESDNDDDDVFVGEDIAEDDVIDEGKAVMVPSRL